MVGDVPARGDIVWIDLDPRVGHEQSGHRPILVLSTARYNAGQGMLIGCPMTSRIKPNPFAVIVELQPPSVVLVEQVRALDWRARGARFKAQCPPDVMAEVVDKLAALVGL